MWLLSTFLTVGTPNGIQRPFSFTYALSLDEHVMQYTCGAHFFPDPLPYSPNRRNKPFLLLEYSKTSLRQMSLLRKYGRSYSGYLHISETFW